MTSIKKLECKVKWFVHDHYVAIGILLFFLSLIIGAVLFYFDANWRIFVSVFGGLFTFVFLVQKHQLDEARFANELIMKFNQRYDGLNNELNALANLNKRIDEFETAELSTLYDYFNLCGEEFLFFKKGYIYPEVWESWVKGMKQYYDYEGIQALWEQESELGSYYQFDLSVEIDRIAKKDVTV